MGVDFRVDFADTTYMTQNPFSVGDRIHATDACWEAYRETYGADNLPTTREAVVTSAGRYGFDAIFDDGTVWEACGVGGEDEPVYFELAGGN